MSRIQHSAEGKELESWGMEIVQWSGVYAPNTNESMDLDSLQNKSMYSSHENHPAPFEPPYNQSYMNDPRLDQRKNHSAEPSSNFLPTELWVNKMIVVLSHWVYGGLSYRNKLVI